MEDSEGTDNEGNSIAKTIISLRNLKDWQADENFASYFLIRKESFSDMVSFLDDNPSAFTFADAPPLLNQWDI